MNRPSLRIVATPLIALSLLIASAGPAAAAKFYGSGVYATFTGGVRVGIVVVDKVESERARLTTGLPGLMASAEYFIIGRSIGCGGNPTRANRSFRARVTADENGALLVRRSITLTELLVTSIWVGRSNGAQPPVCSPTTSWKVEEGEEVVGATTGNDGALGLIWRDNFPVIVLVEKRPNNRARASIFIDLGSGNDRIRVRGVNAPCGMAPTKTVFSLVNADSTGWFKTKVVDMTQNQLDSLRSFRVLNTTEGTDLGCGPLGLIIVVV